MKENLLDFQNGSIANWNSAIDAKYYGKGTRWKPQDFEKMLSRYDSSTDAPVMLFVEEMIEAYPDAKFVLTTRDPDKWAVSVMDNFLYFLGGWRWLWLRTLDADFSGEWYKTTYACMDLWSGGDLYKPEGYEKAMVAHTERVRRAIPKDQLLEFHPSQGWKPLCDFLGKNVPDGEFPNLNEAAALKTLMDSILFGRSVLVLGIWTLKLSAVGAAFGAWWWYTGGKVPFKLG